MRDEAEYKADSAAVEVGARRGRDAEGVNIRPATKADERVLRELWEEFEAELPAPPEDVETWEDEWRDVTADIDGRGAVVRYFLWDRGGIADEYVSLPEYHGPLPPGDVVALAANPTVAERLTGADPARIRAVARTARSSEELPRANELVVEIAEVLGVVWPA